MPNDADKAVPFRAAFGALREKAFGAAAVFSLILLTGVFSLWIRSYVRRDRICAQKNFGAVGEKQLRMTIWLSWGQIKVETQTLTGITLEGKPRALLHEHWLDPRACNIGRFFWEHKQLDPGGPKDPYGYPIHRHWHLFNFCHRVVTQVWGYDVDLAQGPHFGKYFDAFNLTIENWFVAVPYWFFALVFSLLPARWLFVKLRNRRRRMQDLCPDCGYDLRCRGQTKGSGTNKGVGSL